MEVDLNSQTHHLKLELKKENQPSRRDTTTKIDPTIQAPPYKTPAKHRSTEKPIDFRFP